MEQSRKWSKTSLPLIPDDSCLTLGRSRVDLEELTRYRITRTLGQRVPVTFGGRMGLVGSARLAGTRFVWRRERKLITKLCVGYGADYGRWGEVEDDYNR